MDAKPRATLAKRIAGFSRPVARLEAIYGADSSTIQRALTTRPSNGRNALDHILDGDYKGAATVAQRAMHPKRRMKTIRGGSFLDSPTTAVEDL